MVPLTPEQHIERAEKHIRMIEDTGCEGTLENALTANLAAVHVRLASYKKQYPPENGRPVRSSGQMHNHTRDYACMSGCPANKTDSGNYPRRLRDNPQA